MEKSHTSMRVDADSLNAIQNHVSKDLDEVGSFSEFMDMLIKAYLHSNYSEYSDSEYGSSPEHFERVQESIRTLSTDVEELERVLRAEEFIEENDIQLLNSENTDNSESNYGDEVIGSSWPRNLSEESEEEDR